MRLFAAEFLLPNRAPDTWCCWCGAVVSIKGCLQQFAKSIQAGAGDCAGCAGAVVRGNGQQLKPSISIFW